MNKTFSIALLALFIGNALAKERPNILFLFSDDHALRTIGAYEGSINKTPNLDRIAKEGAIFTSSFNVNSICCPSRASIMTGKHSHANGVTGNGSPWNGQQWVYPRELGKAGYQTSLIGKWHLKGNPTDEFQEWEILTGKGGQGSYYNPHFLSKKGPSKVEGYSTDIITDKTLAWLDQRDKSKPFLLCAQFKVPHIHRIPSPKHMGHYDDVEFPVPDTLFDDFSTRRPFVSKTWMALKGMKGHVLNIAPTKGELAAKPEITPPFLKEMTGAQRDAWHQAYDPRNLAYRSLELEGQKAVRHTYQRFIKDYVRCIDGLDENVGRILDYLDRNGLSKNTIVIYSSDQGFFTGEHGWAEKRWMYEESFKSPLLIRWPGTIKPGTKIYALVQNIDLAPTLLTAANISVPKEVHGRALQPILSGSTPANWRKDVLYTYYDGGIPSARGAYNMPRHMGIRDTRYKLIHFFDHDAWEFYDLNSDPNELNNVYDDPTKKNEIERLKHRFTTLKNSYAVPEPAPLAAKKKIRRIKNSKEDNGLAPEVTDLNAADISFAAEKKIPYLKTPYRNTRPKDLKDGIPVGKLGDEQKNAVLAYAAEIAAGQHGEIDSLLLSHKGKLVFESYYRRGRLNYPHYQMSITKSYTAMAIGRAIQLGHLTMEDLDKPVLNFLKEINPAQLVEGAKDITLAQAMNMRSGIRISKEKAAILRKSPNKLKGQGQIATYLEHSTPIPPMPRPYKYQGSDPSIAMQVLEATIPGTARDFIKNEVLGKLGITQYGWQDDLSGLPKSAAGSSMRSRDMLKWGLLTMNRGKWQGEQLIPTEYVDRATSKVHTNPQGTSYGFFWWRHDVKIGDKTYDCRSGRGAGGQFILMFPELDFIAVVTAHNKGMGSTLRELPKTLIPHFQ